MDQVALAIVGSMIVNDARSNGTGDRVNTSARRGETEAVAVNWQQTMSTELIVERRSPLPVSPDEAFAWHARPGAPERLVPPWIGIEVLEHTGQGLAPGSRTRFRARPCGLHGFTAEREHADVEPGRGFTDIQVEGPFDRWMHTHRFEPDPEHPGRSVVHDRIVCELPLGLRLGRGRGRHELIRILAHPHAVTAAHPAMHA